MEERVYCRLKKLLEQIKYFLESCILYTWWWSWNHYSAALLAPGEKTDNETIQKPTLKQHGTTYNDKMEPGEQSGTCVFLLTPSILSDEDWFTEEVGSLCYQRSWKKKMQWQPERIWCYDLITRWARLVKMSVSCSQTSQSASSFSSYWWWLCF